MPFMRSWPSPDRMGKGRWWRRRESNPRPLALRRRLYMLSLAYQFDRSPPDGQGCDRRAR